MRSGKLRHKVMLQEPKTAQDVSGEATGYDDLLQIWANITPKLGNEQEIASQMLDEATHLVEIRWMRNPASNPDINWNHLRVYWPDQDRTLGIVSEIDPDGRKRMIHLQCKELR